MSSCGPYSYCRPGTSPAELACEPPAVLSAPTVPCHADEPTWGDVYEGKDYPIKYMLAGGIAGSAWSVLPKTASDALLRMSDIGAGAAVYFSFSRVAGSDPALPLQDGELVTVRINNPRDSVVRQLYWQKLVLLQYTMYALAWEAGGAASGTQFKFATFKQCGDVHMNLTPDVAALSAAEISGIVVDKNVVTDPFTNITPIGAIIWPNYADLTFERQVFALNRAVGEWVWRM